MDATAKPDLLSSLWGEVRRFLASEPRPGDCKVLSHGVIRHSMSMPRYFLDQPLCFNETHLDRVRQLAERYELRLDVREEADGKEQGNFVLFDRTGNYLGRITTKGLTLTPQRFDETFFRDVMNLYLPV